jgi:DNA-binding GntR family transcriptional regulator
MTGKLDRPAPPYRQIADAIRERIRSGELAPGSKVPSVREVVQEYDVAMATAHRAVRLLQAEGYVRAEHGIGNVVMSETERGWSASEWVQRSHRTGRIYPDGQRARIVSAELAPATDQAAAALGLDRDAVAVRRVRVTYHDDVPLSWSTSWFHADHGELAPKLLQTDRILEGTFAYLASTLGRRAASWLDQYDPALATAEDAERLGISIGSPVCRGRNWIYDQADEVLEYGESVSGSRIAYRGEIDA